MFTCMVQGCGEEAKIGGRCVPHAREEIVARRNKGPEPEANKTEDEYCACGASLPEGHKGQRKYCDACRKRVALDASKAASQAKRDAKKEKDMNGKVLNCVECQRELGKDERVYKGKCPDCRGKSRETAKKNRQAKPSKDKAVNPVPKPRYPVHEAAKAVDEPTIGEKLVKDFHSHIYKAREIRDVLATLNRLTGANFEIPEIEP